MPTIRLPAAALAAHSLLAACSEHYDASDHATAPIGRDAATPSRDAAPDGERHVGDAGSDGGDGTPYGALLSVQNVSIANEPALGRGLSVLLSFTASRAPAYEETPGQPTGCKVWVYDLSSNAPPPPTDQGTVTVSGIQGGSLTCRFDAHEGYLCPVSGGASTIAVLPGESTARYEVTQASFSPDDVGRYLRITGASQAVNDGEFPIIDAPSQTSLGVLNPGALREDFAGTYTVFGGRGPTPNPSVVVYPPGPGVTLHLSPGGAGAFAFSDVGPIVPGGAFTADDATEGILTHLPIDGSAVTLGCSGAGGRCDPAIATVIRMTTTDGAVAGLPSSAMPAPVHEQVELQCATLGGDGRITVPVDAMRLLEQSNRRSPITRVRTAFMREGVGFGTNPPGMPPNRTTVLVGHGRLGYTDP